MFSSPRLRSANKLWRRTSSSLNSGYRFSRPLMVLQSDDWGRVGVRDAEGCSELRAAGIDLGDHIYDFYSLESAQDVAALHEFLLGHTDSLGRPARIVMNFIMANLNFAKMAADEFKSISLLPLKCGLPGTWNRPKLFEAYREGLTDEVFYPALHGLAHFSRGAVNDALQKDGERAKLLRAMWACQTPYIHSRMPWIGYEYSDPEAKSGFAPATVQADLIAEAARIFEEMFAARPRSACAPGYRAGRDTRLAWSQQGIRVAQNGCSAQLPQMHENDLLHLHRSLDFEPSHDIPDITHCMQVAADCFAQGRPFVVSIHSINFHSSIKDYRSTTLRALDELLWAVEAKYPELIYVNDAELYDIVSVGRLDTRDGRVPIDVICASKAAPLRTPEGASA